jgi:hypothetical protein
MTTRTTFCIPSLIRLACGVIACVALPISAASALETISGTVRAEQGGVPIEGVDLDVFDLAGQKIDSATTVTDALGQYTLTLPAPGSYLLRADPDISQPFSDQYFAGVLLESDATPIVVLLDEALTAVDFALPAGVLLSGVVTSSGVALADIDIDLFAGNGEQLTGRPSVSGPDGVFSLGALAPGDYFVRADPSLSDGQYFFRTFFDGGETIDDATAISVAATDITGVDIDLPAGGTIEGVVREAGTGVLLEGIDLDVFAIDGDRLDLDANTASDGSYQLGVLLPGFYLLRADPAPSDGFAITYYIDAIGLLGATPVIVSAGGPTTGIDIALEPSGSISGLVVATIGGPVDAMDIDVYDAASDERLPQGAVSGPDGSFRVDQLKTGTYKLRADPAIEDGLALRYYDAQDRRATADIIAVAAGVETSGIDLVLEPGATISGTVTDLAGTTALEDVELSLVEPVTFALFDQAEPTDAEGRFTLFAVAAGNYLIRATPPAGEPFEITWFGGSTDPDLATVVPVSTGAALTDIDIALPEPSAALASVVALLTLAAVTRATRERR